ncbi:S8 family serine peptidase [Colwellia psychrerythraea]|uniref:Cucumisin n=1 Tax=Colwellia psychrerythraea TaxID=28229 RepID=A0A099KFZ5_COLPS|nr:S8 family serine peptidase [Colwellia psychrerythraea]KGJ89200.1 Cucumisin [Colwellia psychrerythraea]
MHFKKSIVGSLITLAIAATATSTVFANEVTGDISKFKSVGSEVSSKQKTTGYIVQLKGNTAIAQAQDIGELLPSNQLVANTGNRYNAYTPAMKAYTQALESKQNKVASSIDSLEILHSFKHTYNGFSAKLNAKQKTQLESHPDVIGVWEDRLEIINTSNTPEFLGLTGPGGQHTMNIKGEGVIIGIIDTGVWPENDSFADDGSYTDPADLGWQGACDTGTDEDFSCNNKLIGARYFDASFSSQYEVQYALGEFDSPRDADGHGSHTASTAGGNEGVSAMLSGANAGTVSGMAPRARIAAYKACWNSDYKNPEGGDEAGCFYGDTMAAIDAAVTDGVDVINYSIGGDRADLTIPSTAAMLNASAAGVFVAVSAGNSGPDKETVGTPAPWVTSVAASTYNGTSIVIGKALDITSGALAGTSLMSVPAGFSPATVGLTGELALAEPVEACNDAPLTNADELVGKIALIARGSCAFTEKFLNAQNAGAIGALVYTYDGTSPFSMGGSDPAVTITGSMISFADGQALTASVLAESTSVIFTDTAASGEAVEVGNTIASFSSRGPNLNTYDIIKPDITAPGVKILAATTSAPMFGTQGETFKYLQGTSMSSPHIAGMAALFKESNSSWSPAQIKSAMMTTARQNLTKEDGSTQADPYDFGSGHIAPVSALDPGLLFDTNLADYLAFLCGQDKESFVEGYDTSCAELTSNGFSTDASQLNLPSIAIAELLEPETIFRTVSNATNAASTYTASIEVPAGIEVSVQTFDVNGDETPEATLEIDADGKASFALTFTKTEAADVDTWNFGAITWTDTAGHSVRLPLAIKAIPTVKIVVPELISGDLNRGRFRFPVKMLYSGTTSIKHAGLVAPFGTAGNVEADPAQEFEFLGAGTNYHIFHIPEGTQVARFSLSDALVTEDGADLDLYVYRCDKWSCAQVANSLTSGSNENVILTNPEPRADVNVGDVYVTMIHGYSTGDAPATDYTMVGWIADQAESSTRVMSSRRAINGRFNYTTIMTRGLPTGSTYMGAVTYFNADGEAEGTTVLELKN